MINQNEHYDKWVAKLATNPPKVTKVLMTTAGGCCLGWFCEVDGLEKEVDSHIHWRYNYFGGHWATDLLPPLACQRLNIGASGGLTYRGSKITRIFLRENNVRCANAKGYPPEALTAVNDYTTADHSIIGSLIEHLAWVERTLGIECFQPYA